MTHMHIPTVPTARDRRKTATQGAKRRRVDVDPDHTGPYDVTDYPGRHRAPKHRARISLCPDPTRDWASEAACTGGTGWKQVCPSSVCPRHQPDIYAEHYARHASESLVERAGSLFNLDEYAAHVASYGPLDTGL